MKLQSLTGNRVVKLLKATLDDWLEDNALLGTDGKTALVPQGRQNGSSVPAGLVSLLVKDPALKCWAIFRRHKGDFSEAL